MSEFERGRMQKIDRLKQQIKQIEAMPVSESRDRVLSAFRNSLCVLEGRS